MKSAILFLLAFPLFSGQAARAGQGAASEAVLRAMADEMERTVKRLEMEDLGKPYFVSYTVRERRRLELDGVLGALKSPAERRSRRLKVDLRVGSHKFDNTHFAAKRDWRLAPEDSRIAVEDDYDAVRYDIWALCDKVYKKALEKLAKKKAYKQNKLIKEEIPDLSTGEPVTTSIAGIADLEFDRKAWEDRVRRLSSVFRRYPAVQKSGVSAYWSQRYTYFVDSEGRKVVKSDHDFEVYMGASSQAEDGMDLSDRRRFIRQSLAQMPPFEELEAEAVRLAEDITALAKAPLFEDPYLGPVLVEGQAAGEFFNQLLARNLSFSRSIWVESEWAEKNYHSGSFGGRLGLRVVSPILSVTDDPGLKSWGQVPLIGHYGFDDEGIPARRLDLIEKGILKDVPMSRSPIKKRERSNGHGRASFMEFPEARIGNLVIEAHKTASPSRLRKRLIKAAKGFGLDYGLLVRRIAEEHAKEDEDKLAPPLLLYKVYVKDGREELVRSAQFTGVTLRTLRDIVLAGKKRHVYNYYQLGSQKHGHAQVQTSIIHPSVLVSEMELKKSKKKPEKLPYLKRPEMK